MKNHKNLKDIQDMEKLLELIHDPKWLNSMQQFKNFNYEDDKKYEILGKQDKQKKSKQFYFQKVKFIEETNSFIFTSYLEDCQSGKLTDEISDKIALKKIDIIKYEVTEKGKCVSV